MVSLHSFLLFILILIRLFQFATDPDSQYGQQKHASRGSILVFFGGGGGVFLSFLGPDTEPADPQPPKS
jgi:hypothetical protein